MTGRDTPQARPKACLERTKTYGTFLSWQGNASEGRAKFKMVAGANLAEERQVQQDLQRLSVGSHNDELGNAAVQRLGGFVGALLELLVVRGLLDQVQDLLRERRVSQGVGFGVHFVSLQSESNKAAVGSVGTRRVAGLTMVLFVVRGIL